MLLSVGFLPRMLPRVQEQDCDMEDSGKVGAKRGGWGNGGAEEGDSDLFEFPVTQPKQHDNNPPATGDRAGDENALVCVLRKL